MRCLSPTFLASLLSLAFAVACGAGGTKVDVLPLADTTDTVGPYEITAVVSDSDHVADARVFWFTGDREAPRPISFVRQQDSDRWTAELPGHPAGSTIRWRVEVETDDGELVRLPPEKNDDCFPTWTFRVLPAP